MAKAKKKSGWKAKLTTVLLPILVAVIAGTGIVVVVNNGGEVEVHTKGTTSIIDYAEEKVPAVIEGDQGEITEDETIPTVEEIDGGLFKDIDTGVAVTDGQYSDLGWSETYDTSTPEAFKNDTLGKCIIANNYYGAQCVSLARVFWWSYADRDVSTCGTGMAKGMMNCADENAGDDFEIFWKENSSTVQAGDWLVFDGGMYGHVGMALGPVSNGYVALLGENQGGKSCGEGVGGAATNIVNISIKNLIGGYRPKSYIKPVPAPEPEPEPADNAYTVKAGDTLGQIIRNAGYTGTNLFGEDGVAQAIATANGIEDRGLIFPGQTIILYPNLLGA